MECVFPNFSHLAKPQRAHIIPPETVLQIASHLAHVLEKPVFVLPFLSMLMPTTKTRSPDALLSRNAADDAAPLDIRSFACTNRYLRSLLAGIAHGHLRIGFDEDLGRFWQDKRVRENKLRDLADLPCKGQAGRPAQSSARGGDQGVWKGQGGDEYGEGHCRFFNARANIQSPNDDNDSGDDEEEDEAENDEEVGLLVPSGAQITNENTPTEDNAPKAKDVKTRTSTAIYTIYAKLPTPPFKFSPHTPISPASNWHSTHPAPKRLAFSCSLAQTSSRPSWPSLSSRNCTYFALRSAMTPQS